jgi:hypothetical protein
MEFGQKFEKIIQQPAFPFAEAEVVPWPETVWVPCRRFLNGGRRSCCPLRKKRPAFISPVTPDRYGDDVRRFSTVTTAALSSVATRRKGGSVVSCRPCRKITKKGDSTAFARLKTRWLHELMVFPDAREMCPFSED